MTDFKMGIKFVFFFFRNDMFVCCYRFLTKEDCVIFRNFRIVYLLMFVLVLDKSSGLIFPICMCVVCVNKLKQFMWFSFR